MRLIDADELISIFEWNKWREEDKLVSINSLIKLVKARPTAYDVDKVVEKLEEYSNADEAERHGTIPVIELDDAIEIVKGGGVDA